MAETNMGDIQTDYMAGKLKVDEFVTHERGLEDINQAFSDIHVSGRQDHNADVSHVG